MPLSSITKHRAKQCTAKSKRTGLPCKNPAAYGCKSCRMHGARKKDSIKRGNQHPNFVHGRRTLDAEAEQSELSAKLQMLEDAMHVLGMSNAKRSRGRKAKAYEEMKSFTELRNTFEKFM